MNVDRLVAELRGERERIDRAIAALEAISPDGARPARQLKRRAQVRGRRRMSTAARKKLSALLKARWASGKMGRKKPKAAK